MNTMDILVNLLYHILNFILMYVIVRTLVYNPVRKFMKARTERIAAETEEAESKLREADELQKQYDVKLQKAHEEAILLLKESEERAEGSAQKIIDEAEHKSKQLIRSSREQIEIEQQSALEKQREELADLAVEIASKVLKREVSLKDNEAVIDDFFEHVG